MHEIKDTDSFIYTHQSIAAIFDEFILLDSRNHRVLVFTDLMSYDWFPELYVQQDQLAMYKHFVFNTSLQAKG